MKAKVHVIKTEDRGKGVKELMGYFDQPSDRVAIKANYNSADPFPAATHVLTLSAQGSHWKNGFLFPKVFQEAESIVQTCCLKTHQFGGHFTMSLKNSVGMVAESNGHNYMSELHCSPHQGKMIAEINTAYQPEFIIMDGIKGFSKGGPASGTLIEPGVMLASKDRVLLIP